MFETAILDALVGSCACSACQFAPGKGVCLASCVKVDLVAVKAICDKRYNGAVELTQGAV